VNNGEERATIHRQFRIYEMLRRGACRRTVFTTTREEDALVELRARGGGELLRDEMGRPQLPIGDRREMKRRMKTGQATALSRRKPVPSVAVFGGGKGDVDADDACLDGTSAGPYLCIAYNTHNSTLASPHHRIWSETIHTTKRTSLHALISYLGTTYRAKQKRIQLCLAKGLGDRGARCGASGIHL